MIALWLAHERLTLFTANVRGHPSIDEMAMGRSGRIAETIKTPNRQEPASQCDLQPARRTRAQPCFLHPASQSRFGMAEIWNSGSHRQRDPGRPTARRADADTARSAFQESAARLAGAPAPRICACLTRRKSHHNARHLTGRKRAGETPPSRASGCGFASLELLQLSPIGGGDKAYDALSVKKAIKAKGQLR
jgi:hypothetical protein